MGMELARLLTSSSVSRCWDITDFEYGSWIAFLLGRFPRIAICRGNCSVAMQHGWKSARSLLRP